MKTCSSSLFSSQSETFFQRPWSPMLRPYLNLNSDVDGRSGTHQSTVRELAVLRSSSTSSPSTFLSSIHSSHISSSLPSTQSRWPSHLPAHCTQVSPRSHRKLVSPSQAISGGGTKGSALHRFSSVPSSQSLLPSQTAAMSMQVPLSSHMNLPAPQTCLALHSEASSSSPWGQSSSVSQTQAAQIQLPSLHWNLCSGQPTTSG